MSQSSTTSACDSAGTDSGLHPAGARDGHVGRAWRGTAPVRRATTLAPPVGAYSAATGSIAAKVFDADRAPAVEASACRSSGPSTQTQQTTTEGCAFFAFLTPGTYTVTVTAGHRRRRPGGSRRPRRRRRSRSARPRRCSSTTTPRRRSTSPAGRTRSATPGRPDIPISVANTGLQPYSQYSFAAGIDVADAAVPVQRAATRCSPATAPTTTRSARTRTATCSTRPSRRRPFRSRRVARRATTVPLYDLPIVVVTAAPRRSRRTVPTATETTTLPVAVHARSARPARRRDRRADARPRDDRRGSGDSVDRRCRSATARSRPSARRPTPRVRRAGPHGTLNVWVKPDAVYAVDASTGAATTAVRRPDHGDGPLRLVRRASAMRRGGVPTSAATRSSR